MSSEIRLVTRESVARAEQAVTDPDAPAAPSGRGSYAEWAMLALNALRLELGRSYRGTCELLGEMSGVLAELGLRRPPHFTVVRDWSPTVSTATRRAFLDASATRRSGHASIDATGFDYDHPGRHDAQRAHSHLRAPKLTALVDVETLYYADVHAEASLPSDVRIGPQLARPNADRFRSLAVNRGYDDEAVRDELRANGIRSLIKHPILSAIETAHNARPDSARYDQRWMVETVFSSIKRTHATTVSASSWYLEFRKMLLTATVYNLRRTIRYLESTTAERSY